MKYPREPAIDFHATSTGHVALFATDRSLTGQDGISFAPGIAREDSLPAQLAGKIFVVDPEVDHVHVAANIVTARRTNAWTAPDLDRVREALTGSGEPGAREADELRARYYNSTITHIRRHNPDLWVLKVRPDTPMSGYRPGQYTTLGLGYWETRMDDVDEEIPHAKRAKLARRSYSVSSSIVDTEGRPLDPDSPELEFYIVKVPPGVDEIPALTPRLFGKKVGDRLYMGRKFAGRYTLDDVAPTDSVVFLGTGTGEAPHNAMTSQLLRQGHRGRILNVVTVRYRRDLAYADVHDRIERLFPTYRYLAITTREPENIDNKVYIQTLIESGEIESSLGVSLDPDSTHIFLCGNPAMIGLPAWSDGEPIFPEPRGVCQILTERGFVVDRPGRRGNVHYEQYWKDPS